MIVDEFSEFLGTTRGVPVDELGKRLWMNHVGNADLAERPATTFSTGCAQEIVADAGQDTSRKRHKLFVVGH